VRIAVDRERCVGAGQCVLSAPELFDQSEVDGRVLLRASRQVVDASPDALVAADLCPSGALSLAAE
jgi:ferredoxin